MSYDNGKYEIWNGLLWPRNDLVCREWIFRENHMLSAAAHHCRALRGVVQAGGNCGVWPIELSKLFQFVWTFEPDRDNYHCLAYNVRSRDNIRSAFAGLGDHLSTATIYKPYGEANCGAYVTVPGGEGKVLITTIDDTLHTNDIPIDLIYLDIEGSEGPAVMGAYDTIEKWKPIIAFEDKHLGAQFGFPKGHLERYLKRTHDYYVIDRLAPYDVVMGPRI